MEGTTEVQIPSIGRIVIYRSRTGMYDVPAVVTATLGTLYPAGVQLYERSDGKKGVPPLSSDFHVHLTVLTPGLEGQRDSADDFKSEPVARSENKAGTYQEWDIPMWAPGPVGTIAGAGTWRWPERV